MPIEIDIPTFARGWGQWLWGVNSELDAQQFEKKVKKFLTTAQLNVDPDEFCKYAAAGYAEREKEYRDLQAVVQPEEE